MRKISLVAMLALALGAMLCGPASAHEFLMKPHQLGAYAPGQTLPMSMISAHVFMVSEEVAGGGDAGNLAVRLLDAKGSVDMPLTKNEAGLTWDATAPLRTPGTAIVAAHRKPMFWTVTTHGGKAVSKKGLSGVIKSGKYEKFSKTLLPVGGKTTGFDRVVGQQLEIMPVTDPAGLHPGDEMKVKVLFEGKPLATPIYATYDGFSKHQNTYAYFTEDCDDDGVASVAITAPGLWMVRVQHKVHEPNDLYDDHVMRSVLVFEVR